MKQDEVINGIKVGFRDGKDTTLFKGEMMDCILCGRQEKSTAGKNSEWRAVQADEKIYYVCPAHFPADGSSKFAFQRTYERILNKVMILRSGSAH
jgi:hypothetical protein